MSVLPYILSDKHMANNNKKLRYREEHSALSCLVGILYDIYRETIC